MVQITLSGNDYFSYASVAQADEYLVPDINAATWATLTTDQKSAFLIQATRTLDNLTYKEIADTQDKRDNIENFKFATILVASYAATGGTVVFGSAPQATQTKRLKAGEVETEDFRNNSFYFPSVFADWPNNILALLRPYLQAYAAFGATSFGVYGPDPLASYELTNV